MVRSIADIGEELVVVNPHAGAVPDGDAIIVENMADLQVLNNDVVPRDNIQALSSDVGRYANANDRGVGPNLEARRQSDLAFDPHDLGVGSSNGSNELFSRRHKDCLATSTSRCRTDGVVFRIPFEPPRSQLEIV